MQAETGQGVRAVVVVRAAPDGWLTLRQLADAVGFGTSWTWHLLYKNGAACVERVRVVTPPDSSWRWAYHPAYVAKLRAMKRPPRPPREKPPCEKPDARAHAILQTVAGIYGESTDALLAESRDPLLVEARRVAVVLMRDDGMGPTLIGRYIRRDHSTVIHALRVAVERPTYEVCEVLADVRAILAKQQAAAS